MKTGKSACVKKPLHKNKPSHKKNPGYYSKKERQQREANSYV